MARSRKRSRTTSRVKYGVTGLPLPSTLGRRHIGIVMEDRKGNLKQLDVTRSGTLRWMRAEVNELSKSKADKYYNQIERNLDDEDKIRDILLRVLKDVQPKVTHRV